ncbi:MAG: FeoC-like transcriptional regulator [Gammaproteobacteria bacterium]|nr:FeoC-like transcriptional regulator [Gammaproteobacteria bacterium]
MILKELKQYVRAHRQVSLTDIANHFDTEPDAVRGMLDFWIKKGKIQQYTNRRCNTSCQCADQSNKEIYQWNAELGNISIEIK